MPTSGSWYATKPAVFWGISLLLLVAYFFSALATMDNGHRWGDDWAQYVLHTRNLVEGYAYADIGYLFNPDFPNVGPPSYPPGLPLLLAPAYAVTGEVDIFTFKVVCFACVVIALPVIFLLLFRHFGVFVASISVLLFAIHPYIWDLRQLIGSEAPFLLFTMLTLYLGNSHNFQLRNVLKSEVVEGLLIGLLLYCSFVSRSIGVALLPALLIYGWAQRKSPGWFVAILLSFPLLIWMQSHWLVRPATYENELKLPTLSLLVGNLNGYWRSLGELLPLPLGLSRLSALVLVAFGLVGVWGVFKRADNSDKGIRTYASRIPLMVWYLASYLGAIIFAAIEPSSRYLLPVFPIMLALAIFGAQAMAFGPPIFKSRKTSGLILVSACIVLAYATLFIKSLPNETQATCPECLEMFEYIRANAPPGTTVAFSKPRAMALFSGHPSWRPAESYSTENLTAKLDAIPIGFIAVGTPGNSFAEQFPAPPSVTERLKQPDATVVFKNTMFTVFQIQPSN